MEIKLFVVLCVVKAKYCIMFQYIYAVTVCTCTRCRLLHNTAAVLYILCSNKHAYIIIIIICTALRGQMAVLRELAGLQSN